MEKGTKVIIKGIKYSKDAVGLDHNGIMVSMVGSSYIIEKKMSNTIFKIKSPSSSFHYSWHVNDLTMVDPEPIEPVIFNFNPENLDI